MGYQTGQEELWSGEFGETYIGRNDSKRLLASNIALFSTILKQTEHIDSMIEFGSNIGLNLKAVKTLIPDLSCAAIEINRKAASVLREDSFFEHDIKVFACSILEYDPQIKYDLVLTKGVLIHIHPEELKHVYEKLYRSAGRYICMAEYYNPSPVMVRYRGKDDCLFKRDFAGEFLDSYPDVKMLDYGFCYHKDPMFPQDDITWFLMEKKESGNGTENE